MTALPLYVWLTLLAAPPATPATPPTGSSPPPRAVPKSTGEPRLSWNSLTPAQRAVLMSETRQRPFAERLLEHSRRFLDTPYLVSPLGEGEGVDPDPPLRFDAVDCLTFVEAVLALAHASDEHELLGLLTQVRYREKMTYEERNHLMEAQWLPRNIEKGFIRDVTREYGAADTVRVRKTLTPVTWSSRSSVSLQLPPPAQPLGDFEFDMIPLQKVMTHARRVPSGTLLVVVRAELPLKPTRITHLGFIVQKAKRTYLRHAARNAFGRVIDEDLESFLLRNSRYTKWPVEGVSLYAPLSEVQTVLVP